PIIGPLFCNPATPVPSLAPGDATTCHAVYFVTDQDIQNLGKDNIATASSTQVGPRTGDAHVPLTPPPPLSCAFDIQGAGTCAGIQTNVTATVNLTNSLSPNVTYTFSNDCGVSNNFPGLPNADVMSFDQPGKGQAVSCGVSVTVTENDCPPKPELVEGPG